MTEERRKELDILISEYTKEFKASANSDGRFGVLYLSCDTEDANVQMILECEREPLKRMILSLMNASPAIAEDIIEAVENYEPKDPLNLKLIAG